MGIARLDHQSVNGSWNWRWGWLVAWLALSAWLIVWKWPAIEWFALGDTDDNLRLMQVRALLDGQGWYDLRQYRLNPPVGFDIHWSRLVDLPIALLVILTEPFFGKAVAERIAITGAPLMALGVALYGLMLTVRRLVDPGAWPVAAAILACAQAVLLMWAPLRIDHHGWQLAMLILMVAGSADRDRARGGVTTGLATAASLTIGLEMLPYLAIGGAMTVLAWVRDPAAATRLRAYGVALAGGCAAGFALFGSDANRLYVCDVLSPVYLSTMVLAGALAFLLAMLPLRLRWSRFAAALSAGALLAAGFVLVWPECLGRPERISPELEALWFQYITEVKPMWRHGAQRYVPVFSIAVIGTIGTVAGLWAYRRDERVMSWATLAALSLASTGLLFWQTRAGPAAQLLAVPGATWLCFHALRWTLGHRLMPVRVFGSVGVFFLLSGLVAGLGVNALPDKGRKRVSPEVATANRRCPTLPAMEPIGDLPRAVILTFVDLGPRLVTVTHHDAIAGPYHRNGPAILDVHHAFRSEAPEVARSVMRRHGATLLLLCPGMSESTLYATQNPKGFYAQLQANKIPDWLEPVPLPEDSPFRLWRLRRSSP